MGLDFEERALKKASGQVEEQFFPARPIPWEERKSQGERMNFWPHPDYSTIVLFLLEIIKGKLNDF
jgi:hypothetical protein